MRRGGFHLEVLAYVSYLHVIPSFWRVKLPSFEIHRLPINFLNVHKLRQRDLRFTESWTVDIGQAFRQQSKQHDSIVATAVLERSRANRESSVPMAMGEGSKRRPLLTFHSLNNSAVQKCLMQPTSSLSPQKRKLPAQEPFGLSISLKYKRQKIEYPEDNILPPAFWDNLSVVPLTKRALRELDRRNNLRTLTPTASQRYQLPRRSLRIQTATEQSRKQSLPDSTLHTSPCCGRQETNNLKHFARHGGPDLSGLRGVIITKAFSSTCANDYSFDTLPSYREKWSSSAISPQRISPRDPILPYEKHRKRIPLLPKVLAHTIAPFNNT